jgi:hypothetical protein
MLKSAMLVKNHVLACAKFFLPNCENYNFLSTPRLGHHDDQLDEEAIENYYRNRYNEDTAAIARSVRLSHLFCPDPEFSQLIRISTIFSPRNVKFS